MSLPWIVIFHWQGSKVVPNDTEHTAGRDPADLGPEFPERSHGLHWLHVEWQQAQKENVRAGQEFAEWARARWHHATEGWKFAQDQAEADRDAERQIRDYHRTNWDYWSPTED